MTLQQISLDQSIYNKKPKWGTNVQGAGGVQGSQGGGGTRYGGNFDTSNSFVEKQKAEWAAEDKQKKLEREQQMQKAQEIGMQVANQIQKGQQQQQQQQEEIKKKVESNPEPFAEEQWKFFLSLDEEGQQRFIDQIFAPAPQKSTINGQPVPNAKTKYAGGAIADYWINKGYVMFDQKGNPVVNKPEEKFEKGTYEETKTGEVLNTATGEKKPLAGMGEKDWDVVYNDIIDDAEGQVRGFLESTVLENVDPAERDKQMGKAKEYMKLIVSSRLVVSGMKDPDMVKRYADAAVGDFDWQGWLKSKKTGGKTTPPEPTKRDAPFNEEIYNGLQALYSEKPEVITNNLEKYYDLYGKANVDALFEIKPKPEYKVPGNDFKKWSAL